MHGVLQISVGQGFVSSHFYPRESYDRCAEHYKLTSTRPYLECERWLYEKVKNHLRFLSTLWPILQLIAHHIQDKLAVSFDSSSIGLISYKWFLTFDAKYSSVKAYNEENPIF